MQREPAPPPLVIIVGPTGAGKSAAALRLAERTGGEIISADSQQVYRGMDIGTGKVEGAVREHIRHHLIDVVDPDQEMTAARFVELADAAILDMSARGRPIVIAGGTGLYVRILLFGLFRGPGSDPIIRQRLCAEADASGGPAILWHRLQEVDPICAGRVDPRDLRRIVRALEVHELTGIPMSKHQSINDFKSLPMRYPACLIGIAPDRAELYRRIDARVDAMIAAGLVGEVEALRAAGYRPPLRSQEAIGYAELHAHLEGTCPLPHAIELIKKNSRHYARRQLGWYRRENRVTWYRELTDIDLDALERYLRTTPN